MTVLDYAVVTGRLAVMITDTGDADQLPDLLYLTAGDVTFSPNTSVVHSTDTPPLIITPTDVKASIDANGNLSLNGVTSVTLLDLGSSKITPTTDRTKGAWTVKFENLKSGATQVSLPSFSFNPIAGGDWTTNDLGGAQPLPAAGGTTLARGPAGTDGVGIPDTSTAQDGWVVTYDATTGTSVWAAPSGGSGGTVTTADITDMTATGQQLATAADGPSARAAIGAGTSSLTLGTTAGTAKVGTYQPSSANITDATVTGRSLLTAADASSAGTALGLSPVATSGDAGDLIGTLGTAQLPPLAINQVSVVADQAAMLALAAQRGDMAIRQDNGLTYVLSSDSPTTLADWKEVLAAGQVASVAGRTGAVVLTKADVSLDQVDNTSDVNKPVSTAQQTALDGKVPTTRTIAGHELSADVVLAKADVGLDQVDDTSDVNKPVSTAQQAALDLKANQADLDDVAFSGSYADIADAPPAPVICDPTTGVWPSRPIYSGPVMWNSVQRSKESGADVLPPTGANGAVAYDNRITWSTT